MSPNICNNNVPKGALNHHEHFIFEFMITYRMAGIGLSLLEPYSLIIFSWYPCEIFCVKLCSNGNPPLIWLNISTKKHPQAKKLTNIATQTLSNKKNCQFFKKSMLLCMSKVRSSSFMQREKDFLMWRFRFKFWFPITSS